MTAKFSRNRQCSICHAQASTFASGGYDGEHVDCERCGEFFLSRTALVTNVEKLLPRERAKVSAWIQNQNQLGSVPRLLDSTVTSILQLPPPSIQQRADRLLGLAISQLDGLGDEFDVGDPKYISTTHSIDQREVSYLLGHLSDQGLIQNFNTGKKLQVSPKGHLRHETLSTTRIPSDQGFVAMWFDQTLDEAYSKGFEVGIKGAGYIPLRVSAIDHIDKIDDRIIAEIRRSNFVVADFTGHRGGVYFEAGFAVGLNIPVVWTCRKDCLSELHFDIRQYNCIDWSTIPELAERLQRRIEAAIGRGPHNT